MITAILIGLAGGAASGLLGIGGGVVLVPLLVRFYRMPQKNAHGTSLAILVFTAIAAALTYRAAGSIDLVMAAWLALGATVAAPLGARMAGRLSSANLRRAFGVMLALVGIRLLLTHLPSGTWLAQPGALGIALLVGTGAAVGWLSGLLGVGGGTILVPILTLLFGVEQHQAQGVSLVMIIPTAIAGAWTHWKLGHVETRVVPAIAAGSVVAAIAAATAAHLLPAATLKFCFGLLLLWVGGRYALTKAEKQNGPRPKAEPVA